MQLTAPDFVKNNIPDLDDATRMAKQAGKTAVKFGKSTYRDAKRLAHDHPQAVAAIGGGLLVLGVVGLISWMRSDD